MNMFSPSQNKKRNKLFFENGGAVLEQIIQTVDGDCNPIQSFSYQQITMATHHFNTKVREEGLYTMYQGVHSHRKIYVKVFENSRKYLEDASIDMAISSRMSNHKNVLQLLGCCLESRSLILVYEFPAEGSLKTRLSSNVRSALSWEQKLKIVTGIANAIAYLHRSLPKTFIHRDVKPQNVYLDRNLAPKLSDFSQAILIPEGETHVEAAVCGTIGFLSPEAVMWGRYTEKSDVYSFGALLGEVLIHDLNKWFDIMDELNYHVDDDVVRPVVEENFRDYWEDQRIRVQVIEYVKLALKCLNAKPDDRPDIIEAEKELRRIKTL